MHPMPMMVGNRMLQIWIAVPEPEVLDALLILHSYSCLEYSVVAGQTDQCSGPQSGEGPVQVGSALAGIAARCDAVFIPAMLEELGSTFGDAFSFRAELLAA